MSSQNRNSESLHANTAALEVACMVTFETLGSREATYGANNFVEVALKRAVDAARPDDPGVLFVSVSRGYTDQRGQRRYRMHFTMPPDAALLDFVVAALVELRQHADADAKAVA